MPDPLQPGSHLSSDQLSAFAENALPEHERLAALTHLADCPDCRHVVFLAQQADSNLTAPVPATETPRRGWFTLPQIFGAASAALACSLILALIIHHHFEQSSTIPAVTTASIQQPTAIVPPAPTPNLPAPTPAPQKPAATKSTQLTPATTHPLPTEPAKLTPQATPSPVRLGAAGIGIASGYSSGATQKNFDTNSNTSAITALAPPKTPAGAAGGLPIPTPQPRQEARALRSYSVNGADKSETYSAAANTSAVTAPAPPPGTSVAAEAQIINADSLQSLPLAARSYTSNAAAKSAAIPLQLPSKLTAISVLHSTGRTLALDSAGALFLSFDRGAHWTIVTNQWSGKAVSISLAPTPARLYLQQPSQTQILTQSQAANSIHGTVAGVPAQQSPIPTAGFELTTNTGAVFVSTDGLTWRQR